MPKARSAFSSFDIRQASGWDVLGPSVLAFHSSLTLLTQAKRMPLCMCGSQRLLLPADHLNLHCSSSFHGANVALIAYANPAAYFRAAVHQAIGLLFDVNSGLTNLNLVAGSTACAFENKAVCACVSG